MRQPVWHRYMLLFLIPGLADRALVSGVQFMPPMKPTEGAVEDFKNMFAQLARPETETQAAAVTAGLNWYRWVGRWDAVRALMCAWGVNAGAGM